MGRGSETGKEGKYVPKRARPSAWVSPSFEQWCWYIPVRRRRMRKISFAWMAISEACPEAPPEGSKKRRIHG